MKTQTLDLNKMGLTSMSEVEMVELEGGSFWDVVGTIAVIAIVVGTGGLLAGAAWGLAVAAGGVLGLSGAAIGSINTGQNLYVFGAQVTHGYPR